MSPRPEPDRVVSTTTRDDKAPLVTRGMVLFEHDMRSIIWSVSRVWERKDGGTTAILTGFSGERISRTGEEVWAVVEATVDFPTGRVAYPFYVLTPRYVDYAKLSKEKGPK